MIKRYFAQKIVFKFLTWINRNQSFAILRK